VYKCLHGQAPDYLSELCTPVAQVAERQHLCSASRHLLVVPQFQLDTYSRRTFAVTGPTTWNSFLNKLRESDMQLTVFVVHWRRVFLISTGTRHIECIRGAFCNDALYKLTFTFTYRTCYRKVRSSNPSSDAAAVWPGGVVHTLMPRLTAFSIMSMTCP